MYNGEVEKIRTSTALYRAPKGALFLICYSSL